MERKHDIKTLQPKFFECRSVCLDFQLGLCQSTLWMEGDAVGMERKMFVFYESPKWSLQTLRTFVHAKKTGNCSSESVSRVGQHTH